MPSKGVCPVFGVSLHPILCTSLYFCGEEMQAHAGERKGSPSLVWALTRAFGSTFFVAGLMYLASALLAFVGPLILK